MNVLIIGGGAREHALAWKLRQSPQLTDLYVAPGNAGTAEIGVNLTLDPMDFSAVAETARRHGVDLVVVGSEEPLAAGLVDALTAAGIRAYGPTAAAAQIESSKSFAKALMQRASVPTAEAYYFEVAADALAFAESWADQVGTPPVVKADGLAAGKGVTVADDLPTTLEAIRAAFAGAYGEAGRRVLLEERMSGLEVSAQVFTDGTTVVPLAYACDYKRALDGDLGANTGGMGAYSPPGFFSAAMAAEVEARIIRPTIAAMRNAGTPYRGTLYPGLMLTDQGPRVVEFNCRFGDPETQVLMPRLASDLLAIMLAVTDQRLSDVPVLWNDRPAVGVVLVSGGYPGHYETGKVIHGLDAVDADVQVFHAGTTRDGGRLVTSGGRVLTMVASGESIAAARARVYDNIARIQFDGAYYRSDIALRETGH